MRTSVTFLSSLMVAVLAQDSPQQFQREVENPQNCPEDQLSRNGDTVLVSYKGFLGDGTVFDDSKGKEISFVLGENRVIKGWEKGLLDTCAGEKVIMIIPSELGYGRQGAGGVIPPNATLYFITILEGIVRQTKEPEGECGELQTVKKGDQVTMTSNVALASGATIDSSTDTVKEFPAGLVKGWELGVLGACQGEEKRILLGPKLAWGEKGLIAGEEVIVAPEASVVIEVKVDKVEKVEKKKVEKDLVFNFLQQISSGTFNNGK